MRGNRTLQSLLTNDGSRSQGVVPFVIHPFLDAPVLCTAAFAFGNNLPFAVLNVIRTGSVRVTHLVRITFSTWRVD